jgi:hypothetical protein
VDEEDDEEGVYRLRLTVECFSINPLPWAPPGTACCKAAARTRTCRARRGCAR